MLELLPDAHGMLGGMLASAPASRATLTRLHCVLNAGCAPAYPTAHIAGGAGQCSRAAGVAQCGAGHPARSHVVATGEGVGWAGRVGERGAGCW